MIDPNIYAMAKANNNVTLTYDGISTYTATINQYDSNTGKMTQDPIIETCQAVDITNAAAAINIAISNQQNTIDGFTAQLNIQQVNLKNLQMLQADTVAVTSASAGIGPNP